ncbi:protocadherin gamma-A11-like isoform X32 [Brienomyrus brachyistius]|uniref:protocadherin gamma-A11-like isoform X32 n=1 Tax=Brienomyrus brachyistius TaxID=42636 RepID=UPI0020B23812|nr:protocadherin gamma-A11-like isoform X32 [Brienomyrus brachyistius]
MTDNTITWQVKMFIFFMYLSSVDGQVSYSIPEEMEKGFFVGDLAQGLGLDIKRLKSGNARIYSGGSTEYMEVDRERGVLVIKERIDRESLCGGTSPCSLHYQLILENPMEFYTINVEITDINDNSPSFIRNQFRFAISESSLTGAKFVLESAADPDVGINSLQSYSLKPADNFILKQHSQTDGSKNVEMVLQKPLDREKQDQLTLVLTAMDGGNPPMSGTAEIHITVLDINDNAPAFSQAIYKATITENAAKGTLLTTVSASDLDEGLYGKVTYSLSSSMDRMSDLFQIDENNGEVRLFGEMDYETAKHYQINIEAKDCCGLSDSIKIIIGVIDINDNSPLIDLMSISKSIAEDSPQDTVVAILKVLDPDSENNGKVHCLIQETMPFTIRSTLNGFYSLVTALPLDRETQSEYNISVICTDEGIPSLSSSVTLTLKITDVNDNDPVFDKSLYDAYITENNAPGFSILSVAAADPDSNQNARVSYLLQDTSVNGLSVSSFVSVNSETGVVHAVRSFDYEQLKEFHFKIKAQDGGSPPLSSNVIVKIFILDQNDNAPQILYPVQPAASLVAEMVPRSADVGYLVTKVVAVDVDSGQNAWLSYKLVKSTERALFEVGLQNGEIRTIRQISDKDATKQKVTVVVEDNGQPPRSATVNVNVALADSFPEVLSEFSDIAQEKEYNENLTFYLILALAVVSFLFIISITTIFSVKCYRWRRERLLYKSNGHLPVIPYYPTLYSDIGSTGTLPHVYNYDICRTTDSKRSDLDYVRHCIQGDFNENSSEAQTLPHMARETGISENQQKPPNTDWRFSQNQRPGPSGCSKLESAELRWTSNKRTRAGVPPEGAVGTGPWPNPPTEAEQLQALMAAANEVSEATATLGPGTMGLSTRYSPQFTLQHVPDYRQNVYIPGSTATLTANPQQQALPPPQAQAPPPTQAEPPKAAQTPASKKKSAKKEKK